MADLDRIRRTINRARSPVPADTDEALEQLWKRMDDLEAELDRVRAHAACAAAAFFDFHYREALSHLIAALTGQDI